MNSITKDFNGLPIVFREDGYINMTKAIQHFPGKDLKEFFKNKGTKEYLAALSKIGGIPPNILKQATRGRNGVTYGHLSWLSFSPAGWMSASRSGCSGENDGDSRQYPEEINNQIVY